MVSSYSNLSVKVSTRLFLALLIILGGVLFYSPRAEAAAGRWFPNGTHSNNPDWTYALVAKAGAWGLCGDSDPNNDPDDGSCTTGLNARRADFKLFIPADYNPNVTITLANACLNFSDNDKGNTRLSAEVRRATKGGDGVGPVQNLADGGNVRINHSPFHPAYGCGGPGDRHLILQVPNNVFKDKQKNRYGADVRTAILRVKKADLGAFDGKGQKHFRVINGAPNGSVSFNDIGAGGGSQSYGSDYPGFGAFALHDAREGTGNNPETNYTFEMRPDCTHKDGRKIFLKWSDADVVGQPNEGSNMNMRFKGPGGGTILSRSGAQLGGQGWPGDPPPDGGYTVGPNIAPARTPGVQFNRTYTWEWNNVDRSNGVQFWMPYSEFKDYDPCQPPEPPGAHAKCDLITFRVGSGGTLPNTEDGKDNRRWAVWVNDNGSPSTPPKDYEAGDKYAPPGHDDGPGGHQDRSEWTIAGNDYSGISPSESGPGGGPGHGSQAALNLLNDNKIVSGTLSYTIVIYEQYTINSGPHAGEKWRYVWKVINGNKGPCYRASCTVDIDENVPNAPNNSNAVKANGLFGADVTIKNEGINPLPVTLVTNGGSFNLNSSVQPTPGTTWGFRTESLGRNIEINDTEEMTIDDLMAPNEINTRHLSIYPDYYGRFAIGSPCKDQHSGASPVPVHMYQEFNIEPSAGLPKLQYNGDDYEEEPNTVVFPWSATNTLPSTARNISVSRSITKNGSNYPPSPWSSSHDLGTASGNDTAGISSSVFGDEYCGRTTVSPAHGWQGPSQKIVLLPSRSNGPACNDITNRPYLRAYGADVAAGSRFVDGSGVCNENINQIKGYTSPRLNKSGAGAQLAGIAMSTIESFRTASLRTPTNPPTANSGLSFGNTPSPVGQYAGEPICATDFYNETQADNSDPSDNIDKKTVSTGSLSPNSHPDHEQTLYNGNLVLNGANNFNRKKIIYVNGNVRITNNIAYESFSDPTEAPSFMLVASGSIYIANNVKGLDGIYVAQQRSDGTGGVIYTCAKTSGFEGYNDGTSEMFDNCGGPQGENSNLADDKRLIVNGAFIAHHIKFDRIHKSLRDSKSNTNERADHDPGTIPHKTEGSEVFNFSPEIYLSPPPFARDASSASKSPYFTTLPPIL